MVLTKWLKSLSWRSVFLAIVISAILSGILTLSSSIYVGDGWLSLSLVELMPQFLLLIALFAFLLLGCLFLFDLREMWDDSPKRGAGSFGVVAFLNGRHLGSAFRRLSCSFAGSLGYSLSIPLP